MKNGFSEPIPRKGTETPTTTYAWILELHQGFSEPIPRKGTETLYLLSVSLTGSLFRFSEPIPRKGTETRTNPKKHKLPTISGFSEPIPRKGTETSYSFSLKVFPTRFFRTYSPQGDGNVLADLALDLLCLASRFSEPIPRKGTETYVMI